MCEPTLIISTMMTVAGSISARNAAKDQINATNERAYQQQTQINASANMDQFQRAQQARSERAAIRAAAGESGLSGNSIFAQLQESYMNQGLSYGTSEYNRKNGVLSSQQEAQARNTQASNAAPTGFETGLAIAGHVANYDTRSGGKATKFVKDTFNG